jgi:endonuclease/exonuclease/phosphatase (EEP) superfamily protein YafD
MTSVRDAAPVTRQRIFRLLNLGGLAAALAAAVPTVARFLEPGLDTPIPQLAALNPWTLPLWLVAGVLLLFGRRRRSGGAVVLIIGLVIALGVRWQLPSATARDTVETSTAAGVSVRVMTLNVLFGRADADQALALVRDHRIDVLVVEELTPDFIKRLRTAGIDDQLGHSDLHPGPRAAGTGIWSRWPLQPAGTLPSAGFAMPAVSIALPGSARPLGVTGIHTRAPVPGTGPLTGWRRDLAMIAKTEAARDKQAGPQLYVGDFNASRDHAGFRAILDTGLVDAADAVPAATWPGFTWPTDRPGPAFSRIDHILLTPSSIGVRKVTVVDLDGTDHHGVVADLVVRDSPDR